MAPPVPSPQMSSYDCIGVKKNLVEHSLPDRKGERIVLNQVDSEKYIWVIIGSNLTFREYMAE